MGKRRANLEGTVSKRKDGRWQATLQVGRDPNGRRLRRTAYARTQKGAREKLEEMKAQLREHGRVASSGRLSFADYCEEWLANATEARALKSSTVRDYRLVIDKHLSPTIGGVRLDQINALHLEGAMRGKSARLRLKIYMVANAALQAAKRRALIAHNPCELIDRPRYRADERHPLDVMQLRELLAIARGERFFAAIVLASVCGLRAGEIWALRWRNVNLDAAELWVRESLDERRLKLGLDAALQRPKSAKAIRRVVLPPLVVNALREHRASEAVASLHGLVFSNGNGGAVAHTNFLHQVYGPLLDRLGARWTLAHSDRAESRSLRDIVDATTLRRAKLGALDQLPLGRMDAHKLDDALAGAVGPVRSGVHRAIRKYLAPAGERDPWAISFHDLRHSAATAALAAGISPKVISEQLGHSAVAFTLQTYSHVLAEMQSDAADRMQALLAEG